MKKSFFIFHPVSIFIFSLLSTIMAYLIYIYGHLGLKESLKQITNEIPNYKNSINSVLDFEFSKDLILNSVLFFIVFLVIIIIFTYYHKLNQLYRLQENFINNFTHELKTPVASIQLYLETFLKHNLDQKEVRKFSEYMLIDTSRLKNNINQILQTARLENIKEKYELKLVEIYPFLKQFLETNSHLFREATIKITKIENQNHQVKINSSLFEMVLMNLFTNAIKYCKLKPEIEIQMQTKNKFLEISVKDNGIGLYKGENKKIFHKFYQAKHAEKKMKGTGLGLYLSYQIIKLHNGKITAHSEGPNLGTCFIISLPYE